MKKSNKIIIVLLLLILAFSVALFTACDGDETLDSTPGLEFTNIEGGYSVSKGTANTNGNVFIPAEYNGMPVKAIAESGFLDCTEMKHIEIPDSVIDIGVLAFQNCTSLISVTIPNGVTDIKYATFQDCSSLISVIIPDSVASIRLVAFYNCSSLTSVIIPNSVTVIEGIAFSDCSSLKSITIPENVTSIENRTFFNCSSLTSITIGKNVSTFFNDAFDKCSSLASITISSENNVFKSDGNCIIRKADNVLILGCKNSIIPNYVTVIEFRAFFLCNNLTSINIPNSVTSIGNDAFAHCSSLTSIIIPDSVTDIGEGIFYACNSLTVYAEAASKPNDWSDVWNKENRPVVWSCTLSSDKTYVESFTKTSTSITNPSAENGIKAPYRDGYTFKEWNTEATGTGTAFAAADIATAPDNTTLYAIWIKN